MISSKFLSFRGAGDLVVLDEFLKVWIKNKKSQKNRKTPQVTSIPKTLRKLGWNHLTVFWADFLKNRRFLFCTVQALLMKKTTSFSRISFCRIKTVIISFNTFLSLTHRGENFDTWCLIRGGSLNEFLTSCQKLNSKNLTLRPHVFDYCKWVY